MISRNLRHLRLFLAVVNTHSLTRAAEICHISQPAVTQAIRKLEQEARGPLFNRTRQGIFATERGSLLAHRIRRAYDFLDPALADLSPRLILTATTAQLQALVAVSEAENFSLAARRLGLAQPTIHRAVTILEQQAGCSLFQRTSFGLIAARITRNLVQAVHLAFNELDQAEAELADHNGGEAGIITIGSLPLSRSVLLPQVLAQFRNLRKRYPIEVIDGPYTELLRRLRRGEIDVIVGALREPAPISDIVQEKLFDDKVAIIAGCHHPLLSSETLTLDDLRSCNWVVPRKGTPTREQFEALFNNANVPINLIEAGSILLMRGILEQSDHLGCVSKAQAQAELDRGLVGLVPLEVDWPERPIGLTYRSNWEPTNAQNQLLRLLRNHGEMAQR